MKKRKTIDAVRLMRAARERLARKCRTMSFAEQRQYLDRQLAHTEPPLTTTVRNKNARRASGRGKKRRAA